MKAINKIVILGGGTSAWLAASYLSHNLPFYNITVVDKEVGTPVGVGEGTLMNFTDFMTGCGFDYKEWFPECDASLKAGVLFPNWVRKGHEIWHPFSMNPTLDNGATLHNNWTSCQHLDFKTHGLELYDISINHNKIDPAKKYAYHVDANKLVTFIQKKLEHRVSVIRSEMVDLTRDEFNNVSSLILKDGQVVTADLFIDCTGFRGLLNFNPDRNELSDRLICDTAIAGHVQYEDKEKEQRPYVICDAVDHGWIWTIPVKSRMGSGLVFNRSITSVDEAKEYLANYWGGRIDKDKLRIIDWTPFYNNNPWHENVVAVGLSAGFLEPLESTGIALIMEGIYQLTHRIRDLNYTDNDCDIYNAKMKSFFEESINFVSMHYSYTERTEPFWQKVKEQIKVTDEQKFYVDQLNTGWKPTPKTGKDTNFFTGDNWTTWLVQMGYDVAPRNLENSEYFVERWYDNEEKYRHVSGVAHSEYVDRINTLYEKYSKKN